MHTNNVCDDDNSKQFDYPSILVSNSESYCILIYIYKIIIIYDRNVAMECYRMLWNATECYVLWNAMSTSEVVNNVPCMDKYGFLIKRDQNVSVFE